MARTSSSFRLKTSFEFGFTILTAAIVAITAGQGAWRLLLPKSRFVDKQQKIIEVRRIPRRELPLDIKPYAFYRDLLTDEELGAIVAAADPCWRSPNVGQFLHSIRLWGANAPFERAWQLPGEAHLNLYSPQDQLKALLHHPEFTHVFANESSIRTLLSIGDAGISVMTNSDSEVASQAGQYHVDKLLQVLAEVGMPESSPVIPRSIGDAGREWTIADIINESLWKFSFNQEAEFTISAYARWLLPPARWKNRFDEQCSLDSLVNALLDSSQKGHACVGLHLPYALVSAYRANQAAPFLSPSTVGRIEDRMREISQLLTLVQRADGSWNPDWNGHFDRDPNDGRWYLDQSPFPEIYATGHHLEWIALAPLELGPPPDVVQRAVDYLKNAITSMPQPFFYHADVYPLGSHAIRALCLLRGVTPAEIRRLYPVIPNGVLPRSERYISSNSRKETNPW